MTHHLSTEDPALATLVLPTSCRQRAHSRGGPQPLTPKRGRGVAWLWTGAPLLVKGLNSRVVLRPQPSLPDRRDHWAAGTLCLPHSPVHTCTMTPPS